jgi:hypothetical protein
MIRRRIFIIRSGHSPHRETSVGVKMRTGYKVEDQRRQLLSILA